jgi:O-antigen ligase
MALACFALVQNFSGTRDIYWLRTITTNVPFGPFINRDHFAGYIELLIAVPVALIVTRQVRGEQRFLYGGTAMVMGVAAIFTLSRGGMISIFAELAFLGAIALARSMRQSRHSSFGARSRGAWALEGLAVAAILAAILAGVAWIGAEPVINRIATGNAEEFDLRNRQSFYQARGLMWVESWRIFRAHPLLGTGLGAFETAYPAYSGDKGTGGIVAQAHNDYLQILADAGIAGGLLALWFLLLFGRALLRGAMRYDPLISGMTLGCGAGVFGLLVHSLFDFGLQLPSHAVLFLVLSAIVSRLGAAAEEPLLQRATISEMDPALFGQGA